jgi:L-amino acid N-acyltransferase YncA
LTIIDAMDTIEECQSRCSPPASVIERDVIVSDSISIRRATGGDLEAIRTIYNQGIEDPIATLDVDPKSLEDIAKWWEQHDQRFGILVATEANRVVGWASLNRFSHRCAHSAIADLSVYVAREHRSKGIGFSLLAKLESAAIEGGIRKIVLHALNSNGSGKRLYHRAGFVEVGVFKEHGLLNGRYVDVVAMEKLLH